VEDWRTLPTRYDLTNEMLGLVETIVFLIPFVFRSYAR
jgi:hypothetical protein